MIVLICGICISSETLMIGKHLYDLFNRASVESVVLSNFSDHRIWSLNYLGFFLSSLTLAF